jgi:Na+/melibiose symporter-like transporter
MIAGGIAWMVIHALPVGLYLVGLAPAAGTWSAALFLSVIGVFAGAAIGQIVVGIGTTMADIADQNELATGRRQEGVFFGASAFANKCSAALGSYLAGLVLVWIEWPVGSAVRTAADIPSETVLQLAILSGPVTSLIAIPGLLCLMGYALDRTKVADIQAQLRRSTV